MAADKGRCVIVCASPDADDGYIRTKINSEDYVICADGGVDVLARIGITPDLVVGDFDSASGRTVFPDTETVSLRIRKIDTDTMHCADEAVSRGFRDILILGATGGRTDHTLANLSVLLYLSEKGARGMISDKYNDITVLENGENIIHTKRGTTVSVMPFGCERAVLSYTGMSYPLENGVVTVSYPYTISNLAAADTVTVTLSSGSALLFVVHEHH